VLATLSFKVARPELSSMSPLAVMISPGTGFGFALPLFFDAADRIGLCTVTSLVPSGNVASTWTSWIISATPSMTWLAFSTFAPSRISEATVLPSRAPSTTKVGNQRDRLGMIELHAALQVFLSWRQVHGCLDL
jgi:hypothetical protein